LIVGTAVAAVGLLIDSAFSDGMAARLFMDVVKNPR
jgi:hypothetical protein